MRARLKDVPDFGHGQTQCAEVRDVPHRLPCLKPKKLLEPFLVSNFSSSRSDLLIEDTAP